MDDDTGNTPVSTESSGDSDSEDDPITNTEDTINSYYNSARPDEIVMGFRNQIIQSITSSITSEISSAALYTNNIESDSSQDPLPEYSVHPIHPKQGPGFKILFTPSERSSRSSVKSVKFSSRTKRATPFPLNWAHDFTFLPLESRTDMPLRAFFPVLGDEDDNITPDSIMELDDNSFLVLEFTTRETRSIRSLRIACQEKYNKYFSALLRRKRAIENGGNTVKIYFGVIAVGPHSVCSNFIISQELADDLCYRLKIAYAIESQLEPYGIKARVDEEMSRLEKACCAELSSINKEDEIQSQVAEFPEYSKEVYANLWMTPVNMDLVSEQIKSLNDHTKLRLDEVRQNSISKSVKDLLLKLTKLRANLGDKESCKHVGGNDECTNDTCNLTRDLSEGKEILATNLERSKENEIESVILEIQTKLLADFNEKMTKLKDNQKKEGKKTDRKTLIQFPYIPMEENMCHPKGEMDEIIENMESESAEEGPYPRIWTYAISKQSEPFNQEDEDKECPFNKICCSTCNPEISDEEFNEDIEEECSDYQEAIINGGINKGANDRSLYKRVNLPDISMEDQLIFACQGVWGKKFADHIIKINKDNRSREPYSPNADVSDIEDFIMNSWPELFRATDEEPLNSYVMNDLLKDSAMLVNSKTNVDEVIGAQSDIQRTNLFKISKIISDIAMELNLSLKQHTKKDQFILKRLKNYKIYLLIKPTNSSGNLFYSLMWDDDDVISELKSSSIFRSKIKINSKFFCTEFSSTNKSKLTNQISIWAKLHSILAFYMNENQVNPLQSGGELPVFTDEESFQLKTGEGLNRPGINLDLITKIRKSCKSTILLFLIMLHDKQEVEEHFTMVRYICMEGFVALPNTPNPSKMISKFSIVVRSRFTIWVQKKLLSFIRSIIIGGRYMVKEEGITGSNRKKLCRINMSNKFTNEEVNNEGELINMFYLGYGVNKNQTPNSNVIGKLYIKIVEWEDIFDEEYIGRIGIQEYCDPELYHDHEYSVNWIKLIADHLKNIVRKNNNKDPEKYFENQFLRMYSPKTIFKILGTLKASTTFNESNSNPGAERPRRLKVIEAAKDYIISEKTYMYELVRESLDILYREKGLYIDLFKKNQHGGLREIYILNIHSRIVQHCVETMARSICQIFPSETMTNPASKTRLFNYHKKKVKSRFQTVNVLTHCTSDDAKKWNQGHYAAKFALLLCRLMPSTYHPLIRAICFLWQKKKILIDDSLLRIFKKNPDLELKDPVLDKISKIYMNRVNPTRWMKTGARYMKTRTGMMQGILHYTSSLLHTAHNEFLKTHFIRLIQEVVENEPKLSNDLINKDPENPNRYVKPIVTVMQSSDDSAVMITVPCVDRNYQAELSYIMSFCFMFKALSGRLSGIYPSEKSTMNTPGLVEFNSNWLFMNNRYNPYLKHVLSSVRVSGQSTLTGRQQEQYNGVTEIIENGGSMMLAFLCQYSIGLLHYQVLGSSVSHLFDYHYRHKLKRLKLPSLGYFLLDSIHLAGLSGWDFLHWNLCKKTDVGDYLFLLFENNKRMEKMEVDDENHKALILDNCTAGMFSAVTNLRLGANYKLQRLKQNFSFPDDWLEQLNTNPLPLLITPKNEVDKLLAVAAHLSSPGMQESFNDVDCTSAVASTAGYHLKFSCYMVDSSHEIDTLTKHTMEVITDQVQWAGITSEEERREYLAEILRNRYKNCRKKSLMSIMLRAWKLNKEIKDIKGKVDFNQYSDDKLEFISNIFPKESDYLTISDHLLSIPPLVLYKDDKELMNKLSTVQVTCTDFEQFRAPYNLCLCKWFNIGKIDRRSLNYLWTYLTYRYPWIKDNYNDTLRSSPFTDCIQLFSFLSKLEKNDRRVKLLSIPITMNLHESDLSILINNNVWKGHGILKPGEDVKMRSMEDSLNIRNVAHSLYLLSLFPLDGDYKLKIIQILLERTIIKNTQVKSSRLLKLLTLIKYCKGESIDRIFSDISNGSFGVIGVYTRKQYYDKRMKRYTGLGIWEGCLEGTNIKIIVKEVDGKTHLLKIVLSKPIEARILIDFLKEWCEMNYVYNDHNFSGDSFKYTNEYFLRSKQAREYGADSSILSSDSELKSLGLTRFEIISLTSGIAPNCWVYQDKNYRSPLINPSRGELSLEYSRDILRLIFIEQKKPILVESKRSIIKSPELKEESEGRRYTLISHKIQYKDFAQRFVNRQSFGALDSILKSNDRNMLSSWLANESCPPSVMLGMLEGLAKEETGDKCQLNIPIDRTKFRTLITGAFKHWASENLNSGSYGFCNDLPQFTEEVEEEIILDKDNFSNLLMDDNYYDYVFGRGIDAAIEDLGADDEDDLQDVEALDMDGFNLESIAFADFMSHKLEESQVKYHSPLFSDTFNFIFGSVISEEERNNLFRNDSIPNRLSPYKSVMEYILKKKLNIEMDEVTDANYDFLFPQLQ